MVTMVNKIKSLWIRVVIPICKSESGTIGSIFPFITSCETSLIKLFSTTPFLQSEEKLVDPSRNDTFTEIKQDPELKIILKKNAKERVLISYGEAKNIADRRGSHLVLVKAMKNYNLYEIGPKPIAHEVIKVKQHVMNSSSSDHDFCITMKKVVNNIHKYGEVVLSVKIRKGNQMNQPMEYFLCKIEGYVTENSLPFKVLNSKSTSKKYDFTIRKADFESGGKGKKGKTIKDETEDKATTSDANSPNYADT